MNGRYYFFLFLIFVSSWLFANDILVLTGNLSQGGLVFGTVNSDVEKIFWNYQEIPLDKNRFIVGFDRDEKRLQVLTIVLKNKFDETNFCRFLFDSGKKRENYRGFRFAKNSERNSAKTA